MHRHIELMTSRNRDSGTVVRGDGGVAAEGKLVGVTMFHSWGKYTKPLAKYRMSNALHLGV